MATERDFAEILQEKLGNQSLPPQKTEPKKAFSPLFPQWKFHFSAKKKTFSPQRIPNQYPKSTPTLKTKPSSKIEVSKSPSQEPSYKIGEIGLEYTSDLMTLKKLGANINPEKITSSALKKEFRRLAKQYHPDHANFQGSENFFQHLNKAYQRISQAIKSVQA